jgi:hypothetical protein
VEADYNELCALKKPFIYQAQRKLAKSVVLVPCSTAIEVAATIQAPLKEVMFVHSTGRCGSTLLSKLLGKMANVHSISEADVFACIATECALNKNFMTPKLAADLNRASTVYLKQTVSKAIPTSSIVAIKHRSFVTSITDLFQASMPECKVGTIPGVV